MSSKGVCLVLALVGAIVANGQQVENTADDPIQYEGFKVCGQYTAEDSEPTCETCCTNFGFKTHMFWGMGGKGKCICTSFNPDVAASHAAEVTKDKDYSTCASLTGKSDSSRNCVSCCRDNGFQMGAFSGEWTDGPCCCMLKA